MEVVYRCKASKVSAKGGKDVISRMPDNVTANIMDRLPLQDAVTTSILSTSWRFKWTLLTQLILDENLFKIRGFQELTLLNARPTLVKLPTHLFSCLELKHLKLGSCVFPPHFRGFPKLLSLDLDNVSIQDHRYGEIISKCPLLETLKIRDSLFRGKVKLVEIAKLENLKMLSLPLCLLDNITMVRLSTVFHHISLLPKLEELYLSFVNCQFLPEDFTQNAVSTTFPLLKTLTLCEMDFSSASMLLCAFKMLFGCTNLKNLHIKAIYKNNVPLPVIFPSEVDFSTMRQLQLQLQNVNLVWIKGLENEVCLIKCILAFSPILKSIEILLNSSIKSNGKLNLASKLLKLHRASPIAEVIF